MGMIKLTSSGSWHISSQRDRRWDAHGYCDVGGFVMPKDAMDKMEDLKKLYGEPPDDLEWAYYKD